MNLYHANRDKCSKMNPSPLPKSLVITYPMQLCPDKKLNETFQENCDHFFRYCSFRTKGHQTCKIKLLVFGGLNPFLSPQICGQNH